MCFDFFAPVAQLDRVSDSDSDGCRFDPCRVHHLRAIAIRQSPVCVAPEVSHKRLRLNTPQRRYLRAFLQILSRRIGIRLRSPLQQIIENIGVVVASKSNGVGVCETPCAISQNTPSDRVYTQSFVAEIT